MKTHILCLGDSNTHGYCADPKDNADGGIRFNENERWTCRLQTALGDKYLVTEEGLSGRTTVFVDPIHESMDALSVCYALLKSHEVIDLLILMLGTNDVKEPFRSQCRLYRRRHGAPDPEMQERRLLGRQDPQHSGRGPSPHQGWLPR